MCVCDSWRLLPGQQANEAHKTACDPGIKMLQNRSIPNILLIEESIYKVLYIPGGAGFLPSTVGGLVEDG